MEKRGLSFAAAAGQPLTVTTDMIVRVTASPRASIMISSYLAAVRGTVTMQSATVTAE
jgi:hypothetical protein